MVGQAKLVLALGLTAAAVVGAVLLLGSVGSTFAWSLAIAVAVFVAVAWAEAASLRSRGESGYAQTLVWFTLFAAAVFLAFATHVDALAQ